MHIDLARLEGIPRSASSTGRAAGSVQPCDDRRRGRGIGSHGDATVGFARHGEAETPIQLPGRVALEDVKRDGLTCFVRLVHELLQHGRTDPLALAAGTDLEREDVPAALEYAAAVVNEREVPAARPA